MSKTIPLEVKRVCVEMKERGLSARQIYDEYFKDEVENPQSYNAFRTSLLRWSKKNFPDNVTLNGGTYEGFTAYGATVQVSKTGEIVQAWVRQKTDPIDPEEFIQVLRETVEPYEFKSQVSDNASRMLEIPLFDMHWGTAFFDHYQTTLDEILSLICSRRWDRIVIPFGQDFFHNDSIVNGQTTKGTNIEKVDMTRAVKDGRRFIFTIIDAALNNANDVRVIYSPGNHDRSISWMFMQVLIERYGAEIVDDSFSPRKVIAYGKNAIMITHGDSKQATPKTLAQIFPVTFPEEFANANIREVHAGHLHHEGEADIHGVMVRRLSSGNVTDSWHDDEDFVGTHKRFMLFEWDRNKLKSIHYI